MSLFCRIRYIGCVTPNLSAFCLVSIAIAVGSRVENRFQSFLILRSNLANWLMNESTRRNKEGARKEGARKGKNS